MLGRLRPSNGETIEVKVKGLELPLLPAAARARRFSLQVSEARRGAILTMPIYSSFADADEFLSRHLDWLKERVAGLSEPVPFTHGAIVPLRGYAHLIRFAGPVRQRGVVWLEAADDTKVAPAWPQGARLPIRRLPRLVVAGEAEHAAAHARLDEAAGASRSECARRGTRRPSSGSRLPASSSAIRPRAGDRARRQVRSPSPGGSCSRRPSCSTISPRMRSPTSAT